MEKKVFLLDAADTRALDDVQRHLKQQEPHSRASASAAVRFAIRFASQHINTDQGQRSGV